MSFSEKYPDLHFWNLAILPERPRAEIAHEVTQGGAAAIERILKAVGKKDTPLNLDKEALRIAIGEAYLRRRDAFDMFKGSTARKRVKLLRSWEKAAKKLVTLAEGDTRIGVEFYLKKRWPQPLLNPFDPSSPDLPPTPPSIVPFLQRLRLAIADCEQQEARVAEKWRNQKHDPSLRGRRPTEPEMLAGVLLPLVFEWHFLKRAGRSRDKAGKPSGPMVRFIRAAMKELGMQYGDIAKAYTLRAPLRRERRRGDDIGTRISRQA